MKPFQIQAEEYLECPCCYKIPRNIPIVSCKSGHIICNPCRNEVESCPTCRQPLDCTNTVASNLANICSHKCSFEVFGCSIKQNLTEIVQHEKLCGERTAQCPFQECCREIQVKNYAEHALEGTGECAIDLDRAQGIFKLSKNNP